VPLIEDKSQEGRSRMSERDVNQVVVTDIKMPFWSMVIFLVKLAIAAIPAFIILAILGAIVVPRWW
jgi:hypothetical protein